MESVDLAFLLSSPEGISHLNNDCNLFGLRVFVHGTSKKNFVDYGVTTLDEWSPECIAPKGYEALQESKSWIMDQVVTISNEQSDGAVTISDFKVLPRDAVGRPHFTLVEPDSCGDSVTSAIGKIVQTRHYIKLKLRCTIPHGFEGFLGRWIVISFSKTLRATPASLQRMEFVTGLRVAGCVVSPNVKGQLSSEAKPFIPLSAMTYFDSKCLLCPYEYGLTVILPKNYTPIVAAAREDSLVDGNFKEKYFYHSRMNTIPQLLKILIPFADVHGTVGSNRGGSTPAAAASALDHNGYIYRLALCTWMEEAQMTLDIAQYDMHFTTLDFVLNQSNGNTMKTVRCTLEIRGSNENRPKILPGDLVRMRPHEDSLETYRRTHPYVKYVSSFELHGVITSFKLATESCVIEFCIPPFEKYPYYPVSDDRYYEDFLSDLRYHIRFTFERSGLAFTHKGLERLLRHEHLMQSIFPSSEIRKSSTYSFVNDVQDVPSTSEKLEGKFNPDISLGGMESGPTDSRSTAEVSSEVASNITSSASDSDSSSLIQNTSTSIPNTSTVHNGNQTSSGILGPGSTVSSGSISSLEVNKNLQRFNREQRQAIHSICRPPSNDPSLPGLPPYIIFGPPGTGKTSTVIEAIHQLRKNNPSCRILACAPSDSAADVICQRLIGQMGKKELLRLNWWQRSIASVPSTLLNYCCEDNGIFDIPSSEALMKYQVVVCTCGTAGAIGSLLDGSEKSTGVHGGLSLAFDIVIVDEASQATEAETILPLSLCKKGGLMVLAGDPQQLCASLRSPVSSLSGFARSLQERLMSLPVYDTCRPSSRYFSFNEKQPDISIDATKKSENYTVYTGNTSRLPSPHNANSLLVTPTNDIHTNNMSINGSSSSSSMRLKECKNGDEIGLDENSAGVFLTKNYRSHRSIFEVSSRLFYGGALEECAEPTLINSLTSFQPLPRDKSFPVLFIGVDGQHCHELDSPSFYNLFEIEKVVQTCKDLLSDASIQVSKLEIGIIAAFRSQVLKLRTALRKAGLGAINVGSVEDFQGQEMRIIIITTVLSARAPAFEMKGSLGLIGDHRKFNVAVTRGKALCVLIGQPYLLYSDPVWREFLEFCDINGGYTGFPCDLLLSRRKDSQDDSDLLNLTALSVLGAGYDTEDNNVSQFRNDSEWRVIT